MGEHHLRRTHTTTRSLNLATALHQTTRTMLTNSTSIETSHKLMLAMPLLLNKLQLKLKPDCKSHDFKILEDLTNYHSQQARVGSFFVYSLFLS